MRYNRLRDIGLTEDQIKNNLLFTGDKVGDLMKIAHARRRTRRHWFGAAPPDLSVIARAKASEAGSGADWLYTYLRTFYRDDTRPTGWNNMVFPNVGMPHVLWELQGVRSAKFVEEKDPHEAGKTVHKFAGFEQVKPGTMSPVEYDTAVADLVGIPGVDGRAGAEDTQATGRLGAAVPGAVLRVLAWRLNASYWKEVK